MTSIDNGYTRVVDGVVLLMASLNSGGRNLYEFIPHSLFSIFRTSEVSSNDDRILQD
jgi:hypothetical protein